MFSFKWNDKNYVFRPMTPSQVIADNARALVRAQQASSEKSSERETHQIASERQNPYMSDKHKSVLLARKSEMRY